METKQDVINDLISGKLVYSAIDSKDFVWTASKDWATVRTTSVVNYVLDGKVGALQLHVMQCWLKTNKGWQLVARQSTKLPPSPEGE